VCSRNTSYPTITELVALGLPRLEQMKTHLVRLLLELVLGMTQKAPRSPCISRLYSLGYRMSEIVCPAVRVPASSRGIQAAQYMRAPIREEGPSMEVLIARHGASAIE